MIILLCTKWKFDLLVVLQTMSGRHQNHQENSPLQTVSIHSWLHVYLTRRCLDNSSVIILIILKLCLWRGKNKLLTKRTARGTVWDVRDSVQAWFWKRLPSDNSSISHLTKPKWFMGNIWCLSLRLMTMMLFKHAASELMVPGSHHR